MNQVYRIMFGTVHPNRYAIKYGVEKNEILPNKYGSDKRIIAY